EKWASVAVLVSLWAILPVAESATYKSIENRLRSDRNAIHLPSGLIAGPTLRSPPNPAALMTAVPISFDGVDAERTGPYAFLMASCHSVVNSLELPRSSCLRAAFTSPAAAATTSMRPMTGSPQVPPMYAQSAWPQRYGKYFGSFKSSTEGSLSRFTASR